VKRLQPQAQSDDQLLISVNDACRVLGVKRWTVHALLRDEKLAAVKFGKLTLIRRDSLDAFVSSLPPAKFKPRAAAKEEEAPHAD
jgi:excisionase family DNA binding protein